MEINKKNVMSINRFDVEPLQQLSVEELGNWMKRLRKGADFTLVQLS